MPKQEISLHCAAVNQSVNIATPDRRFDEIVSANGWSAAFQALLKLLGQLAWPAAAIWISLAFREELARLLGRVKRGKFGGAEFEFVDYVNEVASDPATPQGPVEPISSSVADQATTNPRGAILSAWLEIENDINRLIATKGLQEMTSTIDASRRRSSPLGLIRILQKNQVLDQSHLSLLQDLRVMRNEAAHSLEFDPPSDALFKYLQLAGEVRAALRAAAQPVA